MIISLALISILHIDQNPVIEQEIDNLVDTLNMFIHSLTWYPLSRYESQFREWLSGQDIEFQDRLFHL